MDDYIRHGILIFGLLLFIIMSYIFSNFIGAILLGIFIYYVTRPVYKFLKQYMYPTISAIIAQLAFIIPTILLIIYTVQIILFEFQDLISDGILDQFSNYESFEEMPIPEDLLNQIPLIDVEQDEHEISENTVDDPAEEYDGLSDIISQINLESIAQATDNLIDYTITAVSSISGLFFTLLLSFALSFYLQRDGERLYRLFMRSVNHDTTIQQYIKRVDRDLKVVFLGNIALAIISALISVISLYVMSIILPGGELLKYPGLLGILLGMGSLIPAVGMKIVYVPVTIVLFIVTYINLSFPVFLVLPIVFLVFISIFVDTIPDFLARPYIGSISGIPSSILFFSYVMGPLLFGWFGLFLGPLIFVLTYEFIIYVLPRVK